MTLSTRRLTTRIETLGIVIYSLIHTLTFFRNQIHIRADAALLKCSLDTYHTIISQFKYINVTFFKNLL